MFKSILVSIVTTIALYQWKVLVPEKWHAAKIGDINSFVTSHGYPIETHQVETDDGYILTIHRIPHGRNENPTKNTRRRPPVLLMHGLLLGSTDWVILGPKNSMGMVLADNGYDVWIGNNRGNTYSRKHKTLNPDVDKKFFWEYSYHEIGLYDLPAMIDYILKNTNYKKISYIGFSQGVTSFLVMGSLRPEYNEKILLMNAFAPVTDAHNITNILFNTLALSPYILKTAGLLGWYEMFDHSFSPFFRLICQFRSVCNTLFYLSGISREQLQDQDFLLAVLSNFPNGMSLRQISHYIQGTRTGIFGSYSEKLNNSEIETYDLTKVTAPIILYYGENDSLVNNEVLVNSVAKHLPNLIKIYKIPYPKFNHMDFLWGKDTHLLTEETLNNLNSFNNIA